MADEVMEEMVEEEDQEVEDQEEEEEEEGGEEEEDVQGRSAPHSREDPLDGGRAFVTVLSTAESLA